ncbi:hypothetical protein [Methylovirgula sp. HY1]|uniref:hypothetical protein n=1 Tax=Methylovirgula sp. HY1 TaxID=2822761 RepID=UPI001C5B50C9|nr:hypothetical protein [Methylovirgula sp. HY1]QXX74464.1 hypothetical protein MHY1_01276 [Methylovirgula sp. HY1]
MISRQHFFQSCLAVAVLFSAFAGNRSALADGARHHGYDADDMGYFSPGNLLVSRVVYDNSPQNVQAGVTLLPPGCSGSACVTATASGAYPYVWNNALADGSFGITAKIFLDQLRLTGDFINSLEVPNSAQRGGPRMRNQMVGSFSSKSEEALNLSTDGRYVTFMGYLAPVDALDASNSNTPGVVDPTNLVAAQYFRVVAQVDAHGKFRFTKTNAYSGNNGRAAILNTNNGADLFYTVGNAGNGANPQPNGIIVAAGAQIVSASKEPEVAQDPGLPTPVGSFSVTQLGLKVDKIGKDDNFRGLTIFNNVVYFTKGSGGKGINSLYFIDTSGFDGHGKPLACPNGVGLPKPFASLPTTPIAYNAGLLQTDGVTPYNTCILKGFPTAEKSKTSFPFGIWFADAKTLYLADEGNGTNTYDVTKGMYSAAAVQATAGLQKWVFNDASGTWQQAYTLTAGLNLGAPYTVHGYPTGNNAATSLPWSPATDGLRNITGRVNHDGTVTIWATTSTVSGNGDEGADPNKLVAITDTLAATALPASESFRTLRTADFGEVLRGVSLTPGSTDIARR